MSELTDEQMKELFELIEKNSIPVTLNISKETEEKALKECDEYIESANEIINIKNTSQYAILRGVFL